MVLRQTIFLKGKQTFEIVDHETIRVHTRLGYEVREYSILIGDLNPEFTRVRQRSNQWYYASIFFGMILTWISTSAVISKDNTGYAVSLAFGGIFLCLLATALFQHRKNKIDATVFFSRKGGNASLVLWQNNPNTAEFNAFKDKVIEAISERNRPHMPSWNRSLVDELRELGNLKNEGIISEEEFQIGKRQIFGSTIPPKT